VLARGLVVASTLLKEINGRPDVSGTDLFTKVCMPIAPLSSEQEHKHDRPSFLRPDIASKLWTRFFSFLLECHQRVIPEGN
jgi:hypothetical protein